jgi:23S rRNA-intervening sequence protein
MINITHMNNVSISLRNRMKQFAVQVFELVDEFPANRRGGIVQSQLARSASSAAANYRAAQRCRSRAEFIFEAQHRFRGDRRVGLLAGILRRHEIGSP